MKSKSFTPIEILVAVTIIIIITGGILSFIFGRGEGNVIVNHYGNQYTGKLISEDQDSVTIKHPFNGRTTTITKPYVISR